MHNIEYYQTVFNSHLKEKLVIRKPEGLYTPVKYILDLGGKRLRPVLALMTVELFGGKCEEGLDAALAIEVFHNFSLVHDDIMDAAPLRRGKTTVHEKWDTNTGILSGDAMLILAYQYLESYEQGVFKDLVQLFSKTAIEVCEGQQYDMDFELRNDVTLEEYLKMITYKTAVLVAGAMKMGAIIRKASKSDQEGIYAFGQNLGIAFQLQDDYLDAFGDPQSFGKQVGGDIIENKKTFLYLKAKELAAGKERQELEELFFTQPAEPSKKVQRVKVLYEETGAAALARQEIERYTQLAFKALDTITAEEHRKAVFKEFGKNLMNRKI